MPVSLSYEHGIWVSLTYWLAGGPGSPFCWEEEETHHGDKGLLPRHAVSQASRRWRPLCGKQSSDWLPPWPRASSCKAAAWGKAGSRRGWGQPCSFRESCLLLCDPSRRGSLGSSRSG